ncbi:MAG: phage tail protein [Novosphingobium sp.]|nr:phage tail protein [Novosphingobium sp.]
MATLVFSAVGTLVGGPLGGAVGALVGRQVDSAILGSGNRHGPRLKELEATTSSYGSVLPRYYGAMRVPGSIIWATDLVEHSATESGGKNQPSVTTYSYTASFAVALASRPIAGIGRIWADGNLLRGADGRLKSNGSMRVHLGHGNQAADPLIAEIEGPDSSPAYRGLAYVVFEDLVLGDFFNRIPALTFEVLADPDGFSLHDVVGEIIDEVDADIPLGELGGWSLEGSLADSLRQLDPIYPLDTDSGTDRLTIARERLQAAPYLLPEPAISVDDGDFGAASGFARKRAPALSSPPEILRYYDIERDYLPGLQRAVGRSGPGQPVTIELPAAMTAANARLVSERISRKADWSRDRIAWRTTELHMSIGPGSIVSLPDRQGRWRVMEWEWRDSGVELTLARVVPTGADAPLGGSAIPPVPVDSGRLNPPVDLPPPQSAVTAFELPWDGTGNGDAPAPFAAVSSGGSNWKGSIIYVDHGDGQLHALQPSGRSRSKIGTMQTALPAASPHLFDRTSWAVVQLLDPSMELPGATGRQLAMGANRALVGNEIIQFVEAIALGDGLFRLKTLLRGRGGTEAATAGHQAGEDFVLLDSRPVALDPSSVASSPETRIAVIGQGDDEPVTSPIALQGVTLKPLCPVHPRAVTLPGGSLEMCWTRRARGAWQWLDGVDAPLHEQSEVYRITYGPLNAPVMTWETGQPSLTLDPALVAQLEAEAPGGSFHVRQSGSYASSDPLFLISLS